MEAKICDRCGAIWYSNPLKGDKYKNDTVVREVRMEIVTNNIDAKDVWEDVRRNHLCDLCIIEVRKFLKGT